MDPDPSYHIDADPDPDPTFKFDAVSAPNPDPQHCLNGLGQGDEHFYLNPQIRTVHWQAHGF